MHKEVRLLEGENAELMKVVISVTFALSDSARRAGNAEARRTGEKGCSKSDSTLSSLLSSEIRLSVDPGLLIGELNEWPCTTSSRGQRDSTDMTWDVRRASYMVRVRRSFSDSRKLDKV